MLTFWIFGYLCTNDDMESKVKFVIIGNYCSVHNNRVQIAAIWIFGYLCTNDDMESKVCEFFVQKLTRDKYSKYEHEDNLCCGRHQDHRNQSLVKPSLVSSCIDKNGHLRHLQ